MTPVGFAVIDHDNSKESRELIQEFEGNHYLYRDNVPNGSSAVEMIRRDGVKLVIDIPQRYGEKLVRNELPQVNFLIDGAFPMMADNVKSYIQGIMTSYETNLSAKGVKVKSPFEVRFSYNENFESVYVMVPGIIMMALMMLPCIMTALGVVREKELGTITNLYTCPATVFQFLLGKQLPYIALAFASFLTMILTAVIVLGVPVTGSLAALSYGALLTVMASTAFGLLVSSFVKSQIAALLGAAVITILPTINFSGFLYPISTLSASRASAGCTFIFSGSSSATCCSPHCSSGSRRNSHDVIYQKPDGPDLQGSEERGERRDHDDLHDLPLHGRGRHGGAEHHDRGEERLGRHHRP